MRRLVARAKVALCVAPVGRLDVDDKRHGPPPWRACARDAPTPRQWRSTPAAACRPQHDVGSSRYRVASMGARRMLTSQQTNFFDTFGFIKLPGLFREDIEEISAGFEEAVAAESARFETYEPLHGEKRRLIIPQFVDTNPRLAPLRTDERVVGMVSSLLGDDFDYAESDGNLLDCETSWHCDVYGSPMAVPAREVALLSRPRTGRLRRPAGRSRNTPFS